MHQKGNAVLRPERETGYGRGLRRVLRAAAIPKPGSGLPTRVLVDDGRGAVLSTERGETRGELPTGSPLCEVCAELLEASSARTADGGGCGELYAEQRALVDLSDV